MTFQNPRQTEHTIEPLFVNRWSPRAFTGEEIPDAVLLAAFEAARWAPSGFNAQPWRFLYAKRATSHWPLFLGLLNERNQSWAKNASALILVLSKTTLVIGGVEKPVASHSFDTGAAWANFSLQANLLGWHTHGIGGFDRDKARPALKVPDDIAIEAIVAIGKQGDKSVLSDDLQKIEGPNGRLPLKELISEGPFAG